MLGEGAYGCVWLVKKKTTNDEYALKIIDCSSKNDVNSMQNLKAENDAFEILTGEYVVKAHYSFTSGALMVFVMEYLKGGDFAKILKNYIRLDETVAKFYVAEIVLAIDYLHSIGIVHRDLKPDNILLDDRGHIKLTDFGLSEVGITNKVNKSILSQQ